MISTKIPRCLLLEIYNNVKSKTITRTFQHPPKSIKYVLTLFHIHFRAVIRKSNVRTFLVQIKSYLSSFKRDRFSRAVGSRRPSDAIVVFERTSDSDIAAVVVACWVVWMLLRRYWSSTSLQQTSLRVRVCVSVVCLRIVWGYVFGGFKRKRRPTWKFQGIICSFARTPSVKTVRLADAGRFCFAE